MYKALKQKVIVQPGGEIKICSPELPEGSTAEVIVILDLPTQETRRTLTSFIGAGKGSFATPEEADEFIRQLRSE